MLKSLFLLNLILTTAAGIWRWRIATPPFRWLTGFVFLNILILAISDWMAKCTGNNLPVFHAYNIVAPALAGVSFYVWIKRNKIVAALCMTCSVFALVNAFVIQGWMTFPSLSNAVNGTLLTVICMIAYVDILHHHISEPGWRNPLLIKTTAFFIYFSATAIVWGPYNLALTRVIDPHVIHLSNFSINILVFLLFGYSIVLNITRAER